MRGFLGLVVVLLGVTACAGPGPTTVWAVASAEVTGVTSGPGPTTVTLHVKVLAGRDGCSRDVRIAYQEEGSGSVFATVAQDSSGLFGCSTFRLADVALTSEVPIGGRQLTLNQQAWVLSGREYRRCDPGLGCDPPADRCAPAWTRVALRAMDVSRESRGTVEACDGRWLVMTVPDGVGGVVRRYFLRNLAGGWSIVARTTAGGCEAVLKESPAFPRGLCAGLTPPNR